MAFHYPRTDSHMSNIIHNCLLEAASQIQILKPEQIALIMHTLKNGFQVCDAGKYGRYETDCADTCIVYLFHGGNSAFNADCGIHFVFEILIKRIYRPRNGNLSQLFQQVNVTHYQIGLRADQDIRTAADKLLQQLSCIAKPLLLRTSRLPLADRNTSSDFLFHANA